MEYEHTTRDGLFSLTITFHAPDQESYDAESIEDLVGILRQTADSLEMGMMDPSGLGGIPQGRPS